MRFREFFEKLGINAPDECFEYIFEEAFSEYKENGVFFLCDKYIDYVNSFENCLSNYIDDIKTAAKKVSEQESFAVYALFLYRAMLQRKDFLEHLEEFEFPEGDETEIRFLSFLPLLPMIPKLYGELKQRNVPDDVVASTLRQFEDCIFLYEERAGKPGLSKRYFDHMQFYIDVKELNIGRLRFEMLPSLESAIRVLKNKNGELAVLFDGCKVNHKGMLLGTPPVEENEAWVYTEVIEDEKSFRGFKADKNGNCEKAISEFAKSEWECVLKKGDPVLAIHIPQKGALTKEACEKSYIRAAEVFSSCFPEFEYKAFHCHCWMLSPQLRDILPVNSNILAFQEKFTLYAGKAHGKAVFNFVFKMKFKEYKDMPEETSLQRALKKHYLDGKYLYEYNGVFFL